MMKKTWRLPAHLVSYIETTEGLDLDRFLQTEAAAGYKIVVVNEGREKKIYGAPFRADNLAQNAVDGVLAGEDYHGMRDLPRETFVTGFFADESANTVGVNFKYNGMNHALFLRPDVKFLFTEVHYLLGGMVVIMAVVSLLSMLFMAKKMIDPDFLTQLTEATKRVGKGVYSNPLYIDARMKSGNLPKVFN